MLHSIIDTDGKIKCLNFVELKNHNYMSCYPVKKKTQLQEEGHTHDTV